jgi:selenide,water dikinase
VGRETSDDAGVYRLSDDLALVQTLDFITPVVNDPYDFGRIAAANSLSDVYAMGGRPVTAMNVVCFPVKTMDKQILKEILRGGLEKVHESGAALVGGHSVEDPEIKFGLSVTGLVHPQRVLTNAGVQAGDALVLTKPIGTGILATAMKASLISPSAEARAIEVMATLNRTAAEVMAHFPVHGCTDVTGFGLLGHALEMALGSGVTLHLESGSVPLLPEVLDLVQMGMVPAGSFSNRSFCSHQVHAASSVSAELLDILSDAQTSGGLIIALPAQRAPRLVEALQGRGVEDAAVIGHAVQRREGAIMIS